MHANGPDVGDEAGPRNVFILARIGTHWGLSLAMIGNVATIATTGSYRIFAFAITFSLITICLGLSLFLRRLRRSEIGRQKDKIVEMRTAQAQIEQLFSMTDTLQSAETNADAADVLKATSRVLLPGCGVALYVFNNSGDRLDLVDFWDMPTGYAPFETLSPTNCWAIKRGKDHLNDPVHNSLCCSHYVGEVASIEVPMLARGSVYGLLVLADRAGDGSNVDAAKRIARALADSTSLALSNIALREQLRTQSLRDPMTGLYNRRYMEDSLERSISLGERKNQSTAALMIDLDNFKALNDSLGHARGDAVLKDAAAQILRAVRPSDIVCRYGGEEILVILPDCSLEEAAKRAEQVRARIEELSKNHGFEVTASIGVSSLPECATSASDLLNTADAALYTAKRNGKNQIHTSSAEYAPIAPRLVVNA